MVGVVHQAVEDRVVWATAGGGAHRGTGARAPGEAVRLRETRALSQAVLVASRREHARGALDRWTDRVGKVRPVSSIAWKLALVASGEADANLTTRPKSEWDVCAGDLLVCEAGGLLVGADRRAPTYNQPRPELEAPLAAGRPELVRELLGQS